MTRRRGESGWRGPGFEGEFPTLGHEVVAFIESYLPVPDGDRQGEPLVLSDAQRRLVLLHYRVRLDATPENWRHYRRSMKVGPKGWGKDPLLAAMSWAEALGPVRFDGWDADGEPVGRPWATPWVQMVATAEDQTDNTYVPFRQMGEYGDLAWSGADIGMTRTLFPGGGVVEPVTSAAATREGQRVTFAPLGETWQWLEENGGVRLARTVRRNVSKMGGATFEITNVWQKGRESVAERTAEAARKDPSILVEWLKPTVPASVPAEQRSAWPDLDDDRACLRVLAEVYEGHGWVDLERMLADARDPDTPEEEARRFYFNAESDKATDFVAVDDWAECLDIDAVLSPDDFVALGFDGATVDDATALVAVRIEDGRAFALGVWQPEDGLTVDRVAVDAAVREAFASLNVWRMYADPPHWQDYIDRWAGDLGNDRVVEWWTNRRAPMSRLLERLQTAVRSRGVRHDGDATLTAHVLAARQRNVSGHLIIGKEHRKSRRKIDACVALGLAWEARADAVASGAKPTKPKRRGAASFS